MSIHTDTPRVAIGCLASYNAGRLIYEWCDAVDVDEMYECQKRVAAVAVKAAKEAGEYPVYFGEPEEFHIQDYDGFGNLTYRLGEYPDYETVAKLGALIEEHGEKFLSYIEACEVDLDDADENGMDEAYHGDYDSEKDYAYEYAESCMEIPEHLESYFDYDVLANELFDHGPYVLHNGHVYNTQA